MELSLEYIHSRDNAFIKEVKKLKDKKQRAQKEQFIAEGFRFCSEALMSDFNVSTLFVSENAVDRWKSFEMEKKLQNNTRVYKVTDNILNAICSTETPQGIAAIVGMKKVEVQDKEGFYVLVDRLQDPGNLGTVIRTAHAAGALGVIVTSGTVDIYNEKTLRSTMGSIFHLPIIEDSCLKNVMKLKKNGFKLVVSSLETDNNFFDIDLKGKVIITVGNEGNGVSSEVYGIADEKVIIPMPGGAESLNAAVAAAVMMFESVRQREL